MVSFCPFSNKQKEGEFKTNMTKKCIIGLILSRIWKRNDLNLGMTQAEFASKLEISVSTYKNIISRRTDKIDIMIAMQIYKLTGHFFMSYLEMIIRKWNV